MTQTPPFRDWLVIRMLERAKVNSQTMFEVSISTIYEDMQGNIKENGVVLAMAVRGRSRSMEILPFNTVYTSSY